jgi:hypothetical protein
VKELLGLPGETGELALAAGVMEGGAEMVIFVPSTAEILEAFMSMELTRTRASEMLSRKLLERGLVVVVVMLLGEFELNSDNCGERGTMRPSYRNSCTQDRDALCGTM